MPFESLTSLGVVLAAGVGLVAVTLLALRNSVATLVLLIAIWIPTVALRDSVDLSVVVPEYEYRISAADVLAAVLLTVGFLRVATNGLRNAGQALALGLAVVLVVHVARGVVDSGLEAGFNDGRQWLYFTAPLLYAATFPGRWTATHWKVLIGAGLLLAVAALPYLLTEGIGSATSRIVRDGESVTSRPIVAVGTLLILQAAVLAVALRWPARRVWWVVLPAAALIVVLQHRTIWVAALLVAGLSFIWWARSRRRDQHGAVFAAVGIALLLLPVAMSGLTRSGPIVESVSEPVRDDSTLLWRITGWEQLVDERDSASAVLFGDPSSGAFTRATASGTTAVSPHNGFIEAYVRFGLTGLSLVLALGFVLWRRRTAIAEATGLPRIAVALLLLSLLVFAGAYSFGPVQGWIVGIMAGSLPSLKYAGKRAPNRPLERLLPST